jgi:ABC-type dipeptide/oligopeptide/nickel transport system permease subunit
VKIRRPSLPAFARTPAGAIGLGLLLFVLLVAFVGPLVAPYSITATVGAPGQGPSSGAPLGTDFLGRDVWSRLLNGGHSVVLLGTAATALSYLLGVTIGLIAGYSRSLVDPVLMRAMDVLLAFPALLILLVLATGLGPHIWVLIVGVALVQLPAIARIIRTTTLEASTRGYVDAAVARGERTAAILRREILPNVTPVMLADFGIRFGYSIVLIASMNFLGLGLAPPAADWGLMISENRNYISLNLWSVLAPAIMLALLTIAVNLTADAYVRSLGRSVGRGRRRRGVAMFAGAAEISTGSDQVGDVA